MEFTVEQAYQGSKVFSDGGPFTDLFFTSPKNAKRDPRIRNSGELVGFKFFNFLFGLNPPTFFYDWLYINTLLKNYNLVNKLDEYGAFSDIEFNPKKSLSCQAYSVALFLSLLANNVAIEDLKEPKSMLKFVQKEYERRWGMSFIEDLKIALVLIVIVLVFVGIIISILVKRERI